MLGKNLNLLCSTFNALGQIFILAYGLILTKYLPPGVRTIKFGFAVNDGTVLMDISPF